MMSRTKTISICLLGLLVLTFLLGNFHQTRKDLGYEQRARETKSVIFGITSSPQTIDLQKRMQERLFYMREMCLKYASWISTMKMPAKVYHNPDLIICQANKVGTTTWVNLMENMTDIKSQYKDICSAKYNTTLDLDACAHVQTYVSSMVGNIPQYINEKAAQGVTTALFTRNPWDRLVSAWRDRIDRLPHFPATPGKCKELKYSGKTCPFETFVIEMLKVYTETRSLDGHWQIQSRMCGHCNVNYTFLGRMETMSEDGPYLLSIIQAPDGPWYSTFPQSNAHAPKHAEYSQYYKVFNHSVIRQLQELYYLDYKLHGYPSSPFEAPYIDQFTEIPQQ